MNQASPDVPRRSRPPQNLEREESQLWRWILLFMILLAAGFAALAWERLESLLLTTWVRWLSECCSCPSFWPFTLTAAAKKLANLRFYYRICSNTSAQRPRRIQLDQLNELIARSQRSFKELPIDSLRGCGLRCFSRRHVSDGQ